MLPPSGQGGGSVSSQSIQVTNAVPLSPASRRIPTGAKMESDQVSAAPSAPTTPSYASSVSPPEAGQSNTLRALPLPVDESLEARIERLGRQRPEAFDSIWAEIGFIFSISMSQILAEYFVSGFTVVIPTLTADLHISAASSIWPAGAFSLTVASSLLIFGRLADMYGGYPVYVAGQAWLTAWSLVAGFSRNELMLNFCRALQGLGPAAFLPSSIMILGSTYRPGPRKNLVFSIYGACAPFGFYVGIFFAGLTAEYTTWGWYFWIGAILAAITALTSYLTIPRDMQEKRKSAHRPKMDWVGAILMFSGLILFTFAIVDSSHAPQGWKTSFYAGAHRSSFFHGSLGIFMLYATFYMEGIMGISPLRLVAWYTPMALGGCIISTFGGFISHLVPGTVLITIAGTSWIIAPLLFAIAPQNATYWEYIFPSMICATMGIDITFNITNVFITTSLPQQQQGLAGGLIMLLFHLGIAVCLGFADIVNTYTIARLGSRKSYQAVFWLEVACAAVALIILIFFVKITKAKSDLTIEEREELEALEALEAREPKSGNNINPGEGIKEGNTAYLT
ncbi:uncharacterized protein BP5553_06905 [Venustampulla echinocandica]|uniref:Major facilitator superfamily (MFS) profile domain-containing protein n=1 Tax=Venustampulla echinocandica TaxID=2656787 RepID=A0A370THY8_9HELO|nr:uncharacterized protein BP5553_06905 [Venustampulla echinocandica]RDL34974.1 hypothetical protein BP5553_06905 [Venustampulla echinocandica]